MDQKQIICIKLYGLNVKSLYMKVYSYLLDHDYGLAPNPFGKYCTLAVCKPKIRNSGNLDIGDWVIGTGSRALEDFTGRILVHHLVYAMKVEEILTFEEYWADIRFGYKKPVLNGSLSAMYGDNIYHKDDDGNWIQEDSAHSLPNGEINIGHLKKDISGKNVLIGQEFYYFGDNAPFLPNDIHSICHTGVGEKLISIDDQVSLFKWLESNYIYGIHGDPINWIKYNQLNLF
jgi:hypothetical protein